MKQESFLITATARRTHGKAASDERENSIKTHKRGMGHQKRGNLARKRERNHTI
jgi:hypothetical protein